MRDAGSQQRRIPMKQAQGCCRGVRATDGLTKVLPKHRDTKQHHAALPYAAVPAFVQGLRTAPDTRERIRLALELLIPTATRTSEVQQARWRK